MEIFEPGSVKSYDLIWRDIIDDREMTVLKAQGCDLDGPLSVYAIRDSVGTVVYVGKSKTVLWRLAQHIGLGGFPSGTEIGKYLIDNTRDFVGWTVTLYAIPEQREGQVIDHFHPWFNRTGTGNGRRKIEPDPPPHDIDYIAVARMVAEALGLEEDDIG
ncbi:MAG: hypothetical protein H6644_09910 [Caldilineaceae bacterium]|nr:hypothetical protein [Caldilineaceae bacterium]